MSNSIDKSTSIWHAPIYTSALALAVTGNSGVTAMPAWAIQPGATFYPMSFELEGQNITTDETLALTMQLYPDSGYYALTGVANAATGYFGVVTFTTLTASLLGTIEKFPGDITTTGISGLLPMMPYFRLDWTLVGTTKSMNFILYASGVLVH